MNTDCWQQTVSIGRRACVWLVAALVGFLIPVASAAAQTTYYVRTDGGSANQCTGTVDAAYTGSGTAQPCAWDHPFQAFPPEGTPRIAGGDTLIVDSGSFRMGYGAPGAGVCDQDYSWDCHMSPLPSGPDAAHPTRVLGRGWDSGCANPPELWGAERAWHVLNLTGSSHVDVACLEITDHSSCIEDHNTGNWPCGGCTVRCERDTPPFGDWAPVGIHAEDSSDVHLVDLNVHGLASIGIHAGRLSDWTVERVQIVANGSAGWDGDLWDGSDSNTGTLTFRQVEVGWNGCAQDPATDAILSSTCWGQGPGGYGDGFAAGSSAGTWVLEDMWVHHNTSDGVDLLYLRDDSTLQVTRLIAEGNAGNPLKTAGTATVENSLLIGNCSYFSPQPLFQGDGLGDNCRAGGNSLAVDFHRGTEVSVINTSVTGEGDCLMDMGCNDSVPGDTDPDCDGTETLLLRNVLFAGNVDWFQNWENTCLYWWNDSELLVDPTRFDHDLIWQCKNDPCPDASCVCLEDPLLTESSVATFDGHLLAGSPAIDAGTATGAPFDDLDGTSRDAFPDIGAYEYVDSNLIFADDFESGTTSAWTVVKP